VINSRARLTAASFFVPRGIRTPGSELTEDAR
jgi:hypothetical protein